MVDEIHPWVDNFTLSDTALKAGDNATVTLVFSEPVDNFSSSNITASTLDNGNASGTLATMTVDSSDNITWTGTFTPAADTEDASNTLSLDNSWTDTVGNSGTDNTTANYEVETKRPYASSFTLSDTDTSYTYGSDIVLKTGDNSTVTLVFSEEVASFSAANITAPNGTLSAMTLDTSDNITWTGTFTPTANRNDWSNRLELDTSYTDTAGNNGIDNRTSNYVVDTTAPTASFSPYENQCWPITGDITVTFDGSMQISNIETNTTDATCSGTIGVSPDNFTTEPENCVQMSILSPVSSSNNKTFTLVPHDNLSYYTTYKIRVKAGLRDSAGNLSIEDNSSFYTSSSPSSHSSSVSGVFVGVGRYGKITRSTDNGSSWDNETCQILTDLYGVTSGNNTFVAVGQSGKILRSTDNGSTFSAVDRYYSRSSRGVTFGNNTFVGVSEKGRIGRSTDSGSNFNTVTSSTTNWLYGVTFGNNTFVAVGSSGRIVRSTDNGSNWSWDNTTSPITTALNGVSFGNNTFVAVGSSGKIVRSTDNGSSFDNETSGISQHFRGITFGNNTFVAVGDSGKIVRSTDNGSNWGNATTSNGTRLRGVTFGNNTFVAVGDSGKIVRSTDNGSTFSEVTSPIETHLYGVSFSE
jgi:photosystem II stability/assembly factor-like uncharacterized protein